MPTLSLLRLVPRCCTWLSPQSGAQQWVGAVQVLQGRCQGRSELEEVSRVQEHRGVLCKAACTRFRGTGVSKNGASTSHCFQGMCRTSRSHHIPRSRGAPTRPCWWCSRTRVGSGSCCSPTGFYPSLLSPHFFPFSVYDFCSLQGVRSFLKAQRLQE